MIECEAKTLGPAEAGRALGVSRNVAYRLIREGTIPALRLGRKLRVPVAALEEMLRHPKPLEKKQGAAPMIDGAQG